MRRLFMVAALAATFVAVLGAYGFVSAAGQRPMNGQIELWGGPTGEGCDANSIRISLAGTGNLAHLGRVQVTATNCTGGTLENGEADISQGSATFTAADGSTISVDYSGAQGAPDGAVASYTTTHTVTGGTGRFADAGGTWTIAGTVDLSIGQLLGDISGWLSY